MDIFLWELHNADLGKGTAGAGPRAHQMELMRALQRRMEHLTLACQAMWELIRENSNISEEMLAERIQEVDIRDGVVDGKMRAQVVDCPTCGRKTNIKRGFCVICGDPVASGDHICGGLRFSDHDFPTFAVGAPDVFVEFGAAFDG